MKRGALFALLSVLAFACSRPTPVTKDPAAAAPSPTAPASSAPASSAPTTSAPTTSSVAAAASSSVRPSPPSTPLDARLRARAGLVLAALKARDMKALAALAHPTRGVRFSAYSYVDTSSDVVLRPTELAGAMSDPRARVWGTHDGKGDPIKEPFAAYYAEFVWTHDFTAAPDQAVDRAIGSGNTINNVREAYPGGHFVELHFPGFDKKYGGMDWESLRLVFEEAPAEGGSELMLVGIVHDEWTI